MKEQNAISFQKLKQEDQVINNDDRLALIKRLDNIAMPVLCSLGVGFLLTIGFLIYKMALIETQEELIHQQYLTLTSV